MTTEQFNAKLINFKSSLPEQDSPFTLDEFAAAFPNQATVAKRKIIPYLLRNKVISKIDDLFLFNGDVKIELGSSENWVESNNNVILGQDAKTDEGLEVIAELDEFVEQLKSEKILVEASIDEYKAVIQAKIDTQFDLTQKELEFISANFVRSEGSHGSWFTFHPWKLGKENSKITKSIAKKMSCPIDFNGLMFPASHLPNVKLISDVEFGKVVETTLPTIEELEERINDLPKGRGYANLGKKYKHSGARIEEFKIGKVKVKKGDKLFFKIGKTEVSGIFSHLNQCVHCPEGYVVVKFEGKNYERRQSRVSLTSAE